MNRLNIAAFFGEDLDKSIELSGKPLHIHCTARAVRALAQRATPLIVEMELAYACFARKNIRFHDYSPAVACVLVTDKLAVYAHAVLPDSCGVDARSTPAMVSVSPRWLQLDYVKNAWVGEYGLNDSSIPATKRFSISAIWRRFCSLRR
ncbi:MAG: hypothetical protein HY081_05225 [Gammaproteobacteria bacterium]|nr:hypothetical protein [Gammaproteobacteria bacterium]